MGNIGWQGSVIRHIEQEQRRGHHGGDVKKQEMIQLGLSVGLSKVVTQTSQETLS